MNKTIKYAIIGYVLVALFTFGNASVFFEKVGEREVAQCIALKEANPAVCVWAYRSTGAAALFSSVFFPFYWSYRFAGGGQ